MNPMVEALMSAEHSRETWLKAWEQTAQFTASGPLGIELVDVDDERLILRMPVTDAARQPFGLLHGGVSMVIAESASSMYSCWKRDLKTSVPVGIEINGSHLRSCRDGHVVAECRVVRQGESIVVHEVKITHEESGRLLNISRVTNMYVAPQRS